MKTLFCFLGLCAGYVIGGFVAEEFTRREAVKAGVGEFYFDNTLDKQFRFKERVVYYEVVPDFSADEQKLGSEHVGIGGRP